MLREKSKAVEERDVALRQLQQLKSERDLALASLEDLAGKLPKSGNMYVRDVLFNNALNTFYLRLYGVRHMVKKNISILKWIF